MKIIPHAIRPSTQTGSYPKSHSSIQTIQSLGVALALGLVALMGMAHGQPYGLEFDGVSGFVEVAEPGACVPGSNSFTIELWVKTDANATAWNLPVEWPGGDRLYVGQNVGNGWNFVVTSNGSRTDTSGDAWIADITGEWVFVQAVLDREAASQTLRVYEPTMGRWHEASVTPAPGESRPSGSLFIPSHPNAFPHHGAMREVRFWHTVRTQSDAEADMYRRLQGDEAGLVGYWPFMEGEGDTIADLTSGEHTGAIADGDWLSLAFAQDLVDTPAIEGQSATLGPVELWESNRPYSYAWYFNDEQLPEADGNRLTIDDVGEAEMGQYRVVVTDTETGNTYASASAALYLAPADWPMWGYDAARSSNTPVILDETLHLQWVRELPEPQRAWRHQWDHRGKLDFDISYSPVVKDYRVYVPSTVTDSVTAYHIEDGRELWRFYADGPVRVAPVAWEESVYFISDDGHLYCVNANDGSLAWKFHGGPSDHRLLGNERIISFWAARGGPVIKDGILYFAAGIWPMHGVFIYALDATNGEVIWVNDTTGLEYVRLPHGGATGFGSIAPQGYIAASDDELVVAGGRTPPAYLNRHTGEVERMELRAKPQGGYAVHAGGLGHQHNEMLAERTQAVARYLDGPIFDKLAAHERLFITTESGALYCFGPQETEPVRHEYEPSRMIPQSAAWANTAQSLVDDLGETEGYALLLGAGSGDLMRELLVRSDLHIVVAEANPTVVHNLRDELSKAGLYGRRAAIIEADPATLAVQPYLFSMVASENAEAAGITTNAVLVGHLLDRLRPYGGVAYWGASGGLTAGLTASAQTAAVDQVRVENRTDHVYARRGGPLTDAGQWTHQYSDSANTNFSPDARAKTPLGILWFGGPSNNNILPRHGHGPVPQVIGGRVILPGNEMLSARCVYTGREIWQREFPGIGHPFTDLELEARFEEGHEVFMHSADGIGANQLGSPFVSLSDAIYVRYKTRIYQLAPETGEIVAEFQLPVALEHQGKPDWGHLSVYEDVIITTVEPQVFGDEHYTDVFKTMADIKDRSWDGTSSERLVVLDRATGDVLWTRDAKTGYRHNAIVTSNDRLFLIDGLSEDALDHLQRRGEVVDDAVLMALDPRTGDELWSRDTSIFGTWLGYSAEHDVLIQGGRPGGLRMLEDEPGDRIAAYHGTSGDPLWEGTLQPYWGPLAIRHDTIYLAPAARAGEGRAIDLLTGDTILREQPHTGEQAAWTYNRRYGCNSHNVSEHLITFRSGAAAFYDLEYDSGTGFFGGFRSGCTNNMVVADGVVNAPDYTRTCTCSYQHQTSLALIHMPEMTSIGAWTTYDSAPPNPEGYGINLGAPGRRVDRATGRIWHEAEGSRRRHPSAIADHGGSIDWVLATAREINGDDEAITVYDLIETRYTVRLHFAELDANVETGQRVFDVLIDDEEVLTGFDIVSHSGGNFHGTVAEFTVDSGMTMTIALRKSPDSEFEPLISGIELVAHDFDLASARH